MTVSPHIGLPYLEASQAQKHVTHNEALRILDALVMLSVIDRDLSAPPASPAQGDRYLVKAPGSGGFADKDDMIAHFIDGAWNFLAPAPGWLCHVRDENTFLSWDGGAWVTAIATTGTELQNLSLVGMGTTADATNPFAAKLNNALWTAKSVAESGSGDLRYKLNKEGAANTLSLLFQTGYAGRAEIGLTGDDDFHFKVSADGASWTEALCIDRITGAATLLDVTANGRVRLAGAVTPASITSDQNDYDPTGFSAATVLRVSSDAARSLTGLAGGVGGRLVTLANVGSYAITLNDQSSASTAANRFAIGADITIAPNQAVALLYDATASRWRALGNPGTGGGGGGGAPTDADYLVKTGNGTLSAERVVIDTDTIAWDWTTAGQAKAHAKISGADKFLYGTAADTFTEATLTAAGRALLDDADAAAQRTTLGVAIGVNVQAYDATLSALAALGSGANRGVYFTGTDAAAEFDLTAFARTLLDDSDATSARTTLGLGSVATQNTGTSGMNVPVLSGANTWSGTQTVDAKLEVKQDFIQSGILSPSQVTADQNDYSPAGLSAASVLRLSTNASRALTGLAGGADGRRMVLHNVGSYDVALADESASSAAANRFALSTNMTLGPEQSVELQYDGTSARWRALGIPGTGGGGGGGAPTDADYLVRTANGSLSGERVVTDTGTIVWDWTTAGQAKAHVAALRELLTAARTYYVRTDGSDSNSGLSDTSGGAFLTIQKAVDTAAALDTSIHDVTIQVADGTYTDAVVLKKLAGTGEGIIQGNSGTPANVLLNVTGTAISGTSAGNWTVKDLKITTTANGVYAAGATRININNIDLGAITTHQLLAEKGAHIDATGNYTISGGAYSHAHVNKSGIVSINGRTVTLSGTPSFSGRFVYARTTGVIEAVSTTFSGSASGQRYRSENNAVIDSNAGGSSYFPGTTAGATSTGGQYL